MGAKDSYNGLELVALRDEENGVYLFGVELDGAFVSFGVRKLGDVDEAVALAREEAEAKSKTTAGTSSNTSASDTSSSGDQGTSGNASSSSSVEPGTEPTPGQ